MKQNKVQFQKGMSLPEFYKKYGTEEQCHQALFKCKWPRGYICCSCGHNRYSYIGSRKIYQCNSCKHQTTVIRGTVFQNTNIALTKWFLAMFLLTQSKNGTSALELMRMIGVSYKTALKMKHKLMQVMAESDQHLKLSGLVEIDDAYLGGSHSGKRGRGSENKQPFVAAVQTTIKKHPEFVKLSVVKAFTRSEIQQWAKQNLSKGSYAVTDGLACFNALDDCKINHVKSVVGSGNKSTDKSCFNWVNTILGNVKNSIRGTYHSRKKEYSGRYLAEFQYRLNRRFNLSQMFQTLLKDAADTPALPGRLLRQAANCT